MNNIRLADADECYGSPICNNYGEVYCFRIENSYYTYLDESLPCSKEFFEAWKREYPKYEKNFQN